MYKYLLIFLILIFQNANATIFHVKENGDDSNNGTSWSSAFATLQKALDAANEGDEIWVAKGTYVPTKTVLFSDIRYRAFQMKNGVSIYGGFPDTGEPTLDSRNTINYETILSGLLDENNGNPIYAYHVIFNTEDLNLNKTAVLDGFTIQYGYANGSFLDFADAGGGMLNKGGEPIISNCIFINNRADFGAAVYNYESNTTFESCLFLNNRTLGSGHGGAMYNYRGKVFVQNCEFSVNKAELGGAVFNIDDGSRFRYCSFFSNNAISGGAVYNKNSESRFIGTIFNGNESFHNSFPEMEQFGGGAMYNEGSTTTIVNCLIYNNNVRGVGAECGGGALFNIDSEVNLVNCTITRNYNYIENAFETGGAGGAMLNIDSDVYFKNSILWGNESLSEANEIYNYGFNVRFSFINSIYPNENNDIITQVEITSEKSMNVNPRLINTSIPPYMIDHTSPAADAGEYMHVMDYYQDFYDNDFQMLFDLRGPMHYRLLNKNTGDSGTVDIGAFEYHLGQDPVSVEEIAVIQSEITIYPNPSYNSLNIYFYNDKEESLNIDIYSLSGVLLGTFVDYYVQSGENQLNIDVPYLNTGQYLLLLRFGSQRILSEMFIIQK